MLSASLSTHELSLNIGYMVEFTIYANKALFMQLKCGQMVVNIANNVSIIFLDPKYVTKNTKKNFL